ncbi:STAS domain-containing protein [Paractinoplanes hotanensis]|uniref:Anti-sigma factor antagonist n=1 Tax=Paractinoplanes hotanensis TaxID=2906497 RepID=A0ABT0YDL6_9ACTN|nr:STAS domain-containing protein [Actinoplanes hotanensis]MCM4083880.1 STAS domain-containing protein [Actinoplanes hotanensis]
MSMASLHHVAPTVRPADSKTVMELVLSGDVDMENAQELRRYLTGALERGADIVIDLADVRLIDCACLDVLVRAARTAHTLDSVISLVTPSDLVRMTLRVTEADILFPICDDRAAALRRCGTEEAAQRDLSPSDPFC